MGDEQGGPACSSPWGHKESDTTEQLNRTELTLHSESMKTMLRKELKAMAFFSVGSRFAFWLLSFHEFVGLVNIVLILSLLLL